MVVIVDALLLLLLIASCCRWRPICLVNIAVGIRVRVAMTTLSCYGVCSVECVGAVQRVVELEAAGQ